MNVIVITLDTQRWDYLGYNKRQKILTPSIDAFARRATIFDRAYCGSFPTIPMRTDAFTGHVIFPRYGWKALGDDEIILTEVLREAGYHTGLVLDTMHMIPTNFPRGFHDVEIIREPPENTTKPEDITFPVPREHFRQNGDIFARQMAAMSHFRHESDWFVARTMSTACDWLQDNYKRDKFFLWVDTFEIHEVWWPPAYYVDLYDPGYDGPDYVFPNYGYTDIYEKRHLRHMQAHYAGEVTLTDRWVGTLLKQIEYLRLFENTMVILISDHGMYLGEHKRTGKHTVTPEDPWPLYEEVAHIPLLVWAPIRNAKKRVKALAQPADIMPTILDWCHVKKPKMIGKSWLPLMTCKARKNWPYVFSSGHNWSGEGRIAYLSNRVTVTDGRWSLIAAQEGVAGELYDLRNDPRQKHNIIRKFPDRARRMQRALVRFMLDAGADPDYARLYDVESVC